VPQILTRAETPKTFRLSKKVSDSYNHADGVATAFIGPVRVPCRDLASQTGGEKECLSPESE
jgi:hypothetical protein